MDIIRSDESANIGTNIRRARKERGIGQTKLIQKVDLAEWDLRADPTREALAKTERGIQHIKVSQLKAIEIILETTHDELLK